MDSNPTQDGAPRRTLDFASTPLVVATAEEIQLAEELRRRLEERYLKVTPRLPKRPNVCAPTLASGQ
jgi:hypothetical protein